MRWFAPLFVLVVACKSKEAPPPPTLAQCQAAADRWIELKVQETMGVSAEEREKTRATLTLNRDGEIKECQKAHTAVWAVCTATADSTSKWIFCKD